MPEIRSVPREECRHDQVRIALERTGKWFHTKCFMVLFCVACGDEVDRREFEQLEMFTRARKND